MQQQDIYTILDLARLSSKICKNIHNKTIQEEIHFINRCYTAARKYFSLITTETEPVSTALFHLCRQLRELAVLFFVYEIKGDKQNFKFTEQQLLLCCLYLEPACKILLRKPSNSACLAIQKGIKIAHRCGAALFKKIQDLPASQIGVFEIYVYKTLLEQYRLCFSSAGRVFDLLEKQRR